MPNSKEVLGLYKQLLERAYKFDNYNFREFAKRKVIDSFREKKSLNNEEQIKASYNEGINQLAMLQRQTTISRMFTFDKLVVEPLKKHH